ncbi:STAS-like domain-containing protein [Ensifer sp. 2YAB10]|uniref:STAS-like domain-containing protein n=1 Tax=unclassified Ensifer TaxID=2633371 RepID=UPI003F8ED56C
MQTISIARDFTPFPGGRYRRHGKGSGEAFREDVLVPLLKAGTDTTIDLDGASGYPPSFLEEAFGGLVREGYDAAQLRRLFHFSAGPAYETYVTMIWNYVDKAARQSVGH